MDDRRCRSPAEERQSRLRQEPVADAQAGRQHIRLGGVGKRAILARTGKVVSEAADGSTAVIRNGNMALRDLIDRARGPLGPVVEPDFGVPGGPFAELSAVLAEMNGFFAFNAGVQVFRVGSEGLGYDVATWNQPTTWKSGYQGLLDDVFCFGEDLFGFQFGIVDSATVVVVDPEGLERLVLGSSLEDWAAWLLSDPDSNGRASTAKDWQDQFGPLAVNERLLHKQLLIVGGEHSVENIVVRDAVECMRVRGPIAFGLRGLPDGGEVRFQTE